MAQNLSGILVRQQLQATIAAARSDSITNPKVGATFQPSIGGGLSNPDADVLYAFKATNVGSAGADVNGTVTLDFADSTTTLGSPATATNRTTGSGAQLQLDPEGNTIATLNAETGRIVAVLCYTNPAKHTSNIRIADSVAGNFYFPTFDFVIGGSDVKSLLVVPRVAASTLTLLITFGIDPTSAGGADELNVVVLGKSA